jgi:hypothetical protein
MPGLIRLELLTDFFNKIGQSRRFSLQKNSEAYRRQSTVKPVTDLPIRREPQSYLASDQNFFSSRNTVLKL